MCVDSLYAIARPSVVCLSSVTFVRPTQPVEIFGNIFTPFGTLVPLTFTNKILRRSTQQNPSVGGVKRKRGSHRLCSDFGHIECYISETLQDRR